MYTLVTTPSLAYKAPLAPIAVCGEFLYEQGTNTVTAAIMDLFVLFLSSILMLNFAATYTSPDSRAGWHFLGLCVSPAFALPLQATRPLTQP